MDEDTSQLNQLLQDLLKDMDIPESRINDLGWLRRNLPFKNSNHSNFVRVWKLLGMDNIP